MIYVKEERCIGCGACVELCPVGAIQLREGKAHIDHSLCTDCERCVEACPQAALSVTPDRESSPAVITTRGRVVGAEAPPMQPERTRRRPVPAFGWPSQEELPDRMRQVGRSVLSVLGGFALDYLERGLFRGRGSAGRVGRGDRRGGGPGRGRRQRQRGGKRR